MAYEKAIATASVTIVDETEASTLTSNMLVIKGSKNQIYIKGQENPYSPDWKKNNLVIRPFLQASNITKRDGAGLEFNADLFSPDEYPLALSSYDYIKDIHWYVRDSSGLETEIYNSESFALSYTYTTASGKVTCADNRQLVIKDNILSRNNTCDIVCKFSVHDPYAHMQIAQQVEVSLINIASGQTNSSLVTNCINGNAITNNGDGYIDIVAKFYEDDGVADIDGLIDSGNPYVSCLWYIRKSGNWYLLDPTEEGQAEANTGVDMYNVMNVIDYDSNLDKYVFTAADNPKGGSALRIYPAQIQGSEVIKCVYTDTEGNKFNHIQVVTDVTDETRIIFHCSNGKRLRKGSVENTTIKASVVYKGEVLADDSPLYQSQFDFYWYKYTLYNDRYVNVVNTPDNELRENEDLTTPIAGTRSLFIDYLDISSEEREAEITVDLVDKQKAVAEVAQASYYSNAISEDDLNAAIILNNSIGLEDDLGAAIYTAKELNVE